LPRTVKTPPRSAKAEETRARILEAALALFREHGFEGTTMRAVAAAAGVSLGSAYYYFASKEELIQAFYARTHEEHLEACGSVLASEKTFGGRLLGVMRAKLDTIAPYHEFAGVLFRSAADPRSPLNPFSEASRPVREEATELFGRVFRESTAKASKPLAAELPRLLWIYHMGIILYWIHDDSPGAERTYRLMERTTSLVVKLVGLSRLPPLRPLVTRTLGLLRELRAGSAASVGRPS
jgi:AcrR family transcriptional regulator